MVRRYIILSLLKIVNEIHGGVIRWGSEYERRSQNTLFNYALF
jgi:hypothetical protein